MHRGLAGNADVDGFLRGDPAAVAAVRDVVDLVVRSFRFPDTGLNKDLVQDVLTRVFANLAAGQFRGDASLVTYARRVARYTCLEHVRRRRHEGAIDPETVPSRERWSRPEESLLWSEEHLRNLEIFSRLPSDCRKLMMMVFVEGLSYREVGRRLGIKEGAVKTRVHRCRACFRRVAGLAATIPSRHARRRTTKGHE